MREEEEEEEEESEPRRSVRTSFPAVLQEHVGEVGRGSGKRLSDGERDLARPHHGETAVPNKAIKAQTALLACPHSRDRRSTFYVQMEYGVVN